MIMGTDRGIKNHAMMVIILYPKDIHTSIQKHNKEASDDNVLQTRLQDIVHASGYSIEIKPDHESRIEPHFHPIDNGLMSPDQPLNSGGGGDDDNTRHLRQRKIVLLWGIEIESPGRSDTGSVFNGIGWRDDIMREFRHRTVNRVVESDRVNYNEKHEEWRRRDDLNMKKNDNRNQTQRGLEKQRVFITQPRQKTGSNYNNRNKMVFQNTNVHKPKSQKARKK